MKDDLGTRKGAKIEDVIPISPWIDDYEWIKFDQENSAIKSIKEVKMSVRESQHFGQECMNPEVKFGSTAPIFGFGDWLYGLNDSAFKIDVVSANNLSEKYKFCNYDTRFRFSKVVHLISAMSSCVPLTECYSQFAYGLVGKSYWLKTDEMNSGVGSVRRYTQNIAYVLGGRELVKKYRKNSIQSNCDIFQIWFGSWIVTYNPTLMQHSKRLKSDEDVKTGDVTLFPQPDEPLEKQYQYRLVKYVVIGRDVRIRKIESEYQIGMKEFRDVLVG